MIHVIIHVLPEEIDQLENLLIQLKRNSVYLPKDHGIKVEVCMNCNLVDQHASKLPIGFFSQKLFSLRNLTSSWCQADLRCEIFRVFWGCNDVRRIVVRQTEHPYIMYLDADCIFSDTMLANIYYTIKELGDSYSIVTPQTTRMWDNTWDCITSDYFMDEEASHEVYDNRDPYEAISHDTPSVGYSALEIPTFKFAGWGTTISTKLARLIDIPDSLGSYGLDDTFIMAGCQILKDNGYLVKQYVINQIIIENNKFRYNPYKDYIVSIDKKEEFLAKAHVNFQPELQKLYDRIKPYQP